MLRRVSSACAENDLIQALRHKDDDLRHNAAVALGGLRSSSAVPVLVERIADSKEKVEVRVAAAWALFNGRHAARVWPRLAESVQSGRSARTSSGGSDDFGGDSLQAAKA